MQKNRVFENDEFPSTQTEIVSLEEKRVKRGQVLIEETMSPKFPKALKSQNLSIQWAP